MKDLPPTQAELVVLASDVHYEFLMWDSAGQRAVELSTRLAMNPTLEHAGEWGLERNACVELFLLHTRSLTHFFARGPHGDDVVAVQYLPIWREWVAANRAKDLEFLTDLSRSINKRLAHITAYRRRVAKTDDARMFVDIGTRIEDLYNDFLSLLPENKRGWFMLRADPDDTPPTGSGLPAGALRTTTNNSAMTSTTRLRLSPAYRVPGR